MSMFSPFAKPPAARPGAPEGGSPAAPEPAKTEPAAPAPRSDDISELKSQLAAMQAKLEELSRSRG
jgi:polyhydroxyalkanoate synthesis regulator protein